MNIQLIYHFISFELLFNQEPAIMVNLANRCPRSKNVYNYTRYPSENTVLYHQDISDTSANGKSWYWYIGKMLVETYHNQFITTTSVAS